MSRPVEPRQEMAYVCRRLYEQGLIAGQDGNISARLDDRRLLVTPAGMSKVDVGPEDLVEVAPDGTHLSGARRASSELGMHLRIYQLRPDVGAVVHAHPPVATGFAVAGEALVADALPEIIFQLGRVPLVPYAMPGSSEVAEGLAPFIPHHDAFLLANHGATTVGPSLLVAQQRMESLEHAARILFTARQLGRVSALTEAQVGALLDARERARADTDARERARADTDARERARPDVDLRDDAQPSAPAGQRAGAGDVDLDRSEGDGERRSRGVHD